LSTGIFPSLFKTSIITPIYKKKGSRLLPNNYRPIAGTPFLSKLLEKITQKQLTTYMSGLGILSSSQFGFRQGLSTEIAAARMVSHIHDVIDRGKMALCLALDLSKAFDCLDHNMLLTLLKDLNFDTTAQNWFRTYLLERSQITCLSGTLSGALRMTIGCPQGTVLSPLLFLIYINSLFDQCPSLIKFAFADDCTLIFEIDPKNIETSINSLNYLLICISNWFRKFRLSVNVNKSQAVLFRTNHRVVNVDNIHVLFDGVRIKIESEMNCLGLTLRYNMSWTSHVNKVIVKCSTVIAALRRLRESGIPLACLMIIYRQLYMSYISYMAPVWAECGINNMNRLQINQNQSLRAIFDMPRDASVRHLYSEIKTMTIQQHLKYFTCLYAFRNFKLMTDINIMYVYRQVFDRVHRNNILLIPNRHGLFLTRRDLNYRICILWNELDDKLRNLLGINCFKKLLKIKLMETTDTWGG
jgi:hypothetical protein